MKNLKLSLAVASMLTLNAVSFADDASDIAELKQQIQELQEQTQTLIDETSDMQTGFNYTKADTTKTHSGLGPAASKVYYSKSPLSIGGYGEMYLSGTKNEDGSHSSETQVKRFITYFGYKFSDNIVLNAEIEYEGGGVTADGGGDEVIVEFMYLDFMQNKNFNVRAGNFLMPMGLVNQQHEPVLFNTAQRPSTEYYLIPSTWNESGVMAYGEITSSLDYKVAATTALQTKSDTADGDKPKWIRSARGGAFKVESPSIAFTGRLDYTGINGLLVGTSAYYAPTAAISGTSENADILMFDAHIDYKINGFRTYGAYTQTNRTNANAIAADTGSAVKKANGGYLNLSYDVLSLTSSAYKLPLFAQYETINARASVAGAQDSDSIDTTTVGLNFFPHEQVVVKVDYAMANGSIKSYVNNNDSSDTISVSLGFIF